MKRLLSTLVAICIFSFVGLAASVAAPSLPDETATEESLRIEFATQGGVAQAAPYFAVEGAYPGMEPQKAVVTIHNAGTVDVVLDVSVALTAHSRGPNLADVLQVRVTAEDSGMTVYRGSLSELRFDGTAALPAGGSDSYVIAIAWPDGGEADNAFQGVGLEFELRARARQAV